MFDDIQKRFEKQKEFNDLQIQIYSEDRKNDLKELKSITHTSNEVLQNQYNFEAKLNDKIQNDPTNM
jgi:hypothetical protein